MVTPSGKDKDENDSYSDACDNTTFSAKNGYARGGPADRV